MSDKRARVRAISRRMPRGRDVDAAQFLGWLVELADVSPLAAGLVLRRAARELRRMEDAR